MANQPEKRAFMETAEGKTFQQTQAPVVRSSIASPEGALCPPPALVLQHLVESDWLDDSSVSDSHHGLSALRAAWHEMTEILANRPIVEVPEVFEMPPAPRVRVHGRVLGVRVPPFVFVDDLADQAEG